MGVGYKHRRFPSGIGTPTLPASSLISGIHQLSARFILRRKHGLAQLGPILSYWLCVKCHSQRCIAINTLDDHQRGMQLGNQTPVQIYAGSLPGSKPSAPAIR